jgi:hypothetical protein
MSRCLCAHLPFFFVALGCPHHRKSEGCYWETVASFYGEDELKEGPLETGFCFLFTLLKKTFLVFSVGCDRSTLKIKSLISVADTKDQISIIKKTLDRFGPSPAIGNEDGGRRKVGEEIRVRNDGVPAQLLISAAPRPRRRSWLHSRGHLLPWPPANDEDTARREAGCLG